ncbi:MAG: hypothetical protein IKS10_00390 [Lachnospiraceae bacterium]|nr:hypothetical protein [Lachnospiraceae bacterium]
MKKNDSKIEAKKVRVEQELAALSAIPDEELYERLDSCEEGLNQVQASDRLEEYGKILKAVYIKINKEWV